jgi:preprotein translocase subunit SecF
MIRFMKLTWLYFGISAMVIVPGLVSLAMNGLRLSIDFTGGTELQLRVIPVDGQAYDQQSLVNAFSSTAEITQIQLQENREVLVQAKQMSTEQKDAAVAKVKETYPDTTELRFLTVGPTLGQELLIKTVVAILLSTLGVALYVGYRFTEWRYGICAVLAMLHDTLVLFGVFSLLGYFLGVEVDVLFVTAVLTILSFSVHDTIVVFDRIRELRRKRSNVQYEELIDTAVTETMSRSINNSLTIIFMLLVLWLFGGESIRWFVFALLVGTVTGTYSSTFTAAPLLVVWEKVVRRMKKK